MIFRQLLNESIAAASYLIGCVASGEAVVVDPGLPAERYALLAADKGLRITRILETHLHADYFSTGRALAAITGARIGLPRRAEARFDHDPLDDGDELCVGNVLIRALHTPGHTPEHTSYLVTDTARAEQPWFVLTGDCLFVGDVGRADLVDLPLTGPDHLYDSIAKLLALPDDVEIYPGHFGGSACGGKAMSGKVSSTIGFERRFNWALRAPDRATFTDWVSGEPRGVVEDVLRHRHTNQGLLPLPPDLAAPVVPVAAPLLDLAVAAEALSAGAALIDVRPRDAFLAGHPSGALNAPYSSEALAGRVAALTTPDEPIVVIADNAAVASAAAALLAGVGRNPVRGYLAATPAEWAALGAPATSIPALDVDELAHRVAAGACRALDVREPFEWARGVIPGALLISHAELAGRIDEIPAGRPICVICESGTRATMAASLLRRHGWTEVAVVAPEGMSEYAARHPTVAV